MNKELLLNDLAQLLMINVDLLNDSFLLKEQGLWDSLAVVSTVAVIDQHYNHSVKGSELMKCSNIGDIFHLIESKAPIKVEEVICDAR